MVESIRKINDLEYEIDFNNSVVVTMKIEEEFLEEIDKATTVLGFKNRSDLIRDALKEYLKSLNTES
ncbi:ribbon-helix-helix domain-containing protein [Acidianus sp. HS-5]|uniref:ribbon-helix-helix domain-containing protein n=1 Tax=Acidianus sp. HS-5 TaxID=2886040 RepID=UPI001F1A3774|nr:ribbon-helix-helix domain-containing protein [Acidianus sp. HS-5]BDC17324.1 CopG family transcriptional regulator [Acidianus sp. HS-5]